MKFIKDFQEINKKDILVAGGKGANLGEMAKSKIPVPPGFVILASAFRKFLEETNIDIEINRLINQINFKDTESVEEGSEILRHLIKKFRMPRSIEGEIIKAFKRLGAKYVAVRSSATAEDSKIDSWAGQLETYLNVTRGNLIECVKKCWASLYTPRALLYQEKRGLKKGNVLVAVVIQKMIQSEISGVCFNVHPVTRNKNQMIIEACWGLGEALVQGLITPDSYVIQKSNFKILDTNVNSQEKMIIRKGNGTEMVSVPETKRDKQKILEKQIKELAKICLKIQNHYKEPQDIEWAFEKNKFYIVQSRPITTL